MAAHNMHKTLPRELKAAKYYYRSKAKAHMQTVKVMEKRLTTIKKEKPKKQAFIRLTFDDANKVGRNIVLAQNLGFSYDNKRWLFRHTDFFIQRGERIALIGPNGAGKTTLLQVLLGQMNPNEGSIYKAPVKTAYLAQELDNLKDSNTVLEEVTGGNRAENQAYVRTMLGCLLFVGDDVNKKVAALSQGEKARLTIAKILYESPDLLILDEPTNGLDITSRERIEDALESYNGTLIIASHDRFLLRRLTDKIFAIGDGTIEIYPGNYDDFQGRISNTQKMDIEAQCLLLDTRLAQMSAALIDAPADEKEMLTEEFIKTSRQLRALKEKHELPF